MTSVGGVRKSGTSGHEPDATLVARAVDGEPAAVDELLRRVHPVAVRYCRGRVQGFLPGATVEDLAQQVCVAVLGALPRYRQRGTPFLAFVHRIARNEVADAYRAAARGPLPAEEVPERADPAAGPEACAVVGDDVRRLRPALARISPAAREVLVLRLAVGLSVEETAAAVGRTAGAVRVMQHRALAIVRRALGAPVGA